MDIMIRHDDGAEEMILAIAALMFYAFAVLMALGAWVMSTPEMLYATLMGGFFGGIFHFIKVSSDGRVRERQRAEYVQRAERKRIDPREGSC
jgi:fatty acid desaturase